ncbi:hypothetical protein VTO42DRAFT_8648 [Malbranchea cinnamomea]
MTATSTEAAARPPQMKSESNGDGNMAEQQGQSEPQKQPDRKGETSVQDGQKATTASNAKDPLRPRRKKAKRACFACQRAHLTCGDERPCQRCIKRGLQDACQDGVRKKAKYLHDAPNEALMPGIRGSNYNQPRALEMSHNGTNTSKSSRQDSSPAFYSQQQGNGYNNFVPTKGDGSMPHPQLQDNTVHPRATFNAQSPMSPTFTMNNSAVHNQNMPPLAQSSSTTTPSTSGQNQNQFGSAFFDPSDPALFNFDLASMNFGNHYGALEFGMLGHMATGVGDTPPSDSATQRGSIGRSGSGQFAAPSTAASNFGESPNAQTSFLFDQSPMGDWTQGNRNVYGQNMGMSDMPNAFAIESAPANFASPNSTESPLLNSTVAFDDPKNPAFSSGMGTSSQPRQPQPPAPVVSTPQLRYQGLHLDRKRRRRDPSSIYENVKEPYSYTSGFHSLTAFIQRRFSPQKTLQIAKALASIRPSFIATAKTLNRDDLIFMEKCFQRTLYEYEDFINACGTPTIVCRRTGEIAAVGKEFSILTGWKKEVLLGKEPNLNINTGGTSGSLAASSSRGNYTPRGAPGNNSYPTGRTQPVFIAELLDDDSVIEFYEDFARLAFGDSRGSVMTTCKLLKYKTKEDMELVASGEGEDGRDGGGSSGVNNTGTTSQQQRGWSKGGIASEAGMNQLGFRDGKVECSYCWTVKRDVFDIPMLIVMNFLPCI